MKEELIQKYSKEVCLSCESMIYGKRKFTLPQKSRLLDNFYKYSKNKQLVGPIADGSAQGYDAVLLMIHFGFCSARNFPGNHLVIIESKTGIGIYEGINKNEKEPVFKEYENKLEKVGRSKAIHFMAQTFFFGVVGVILGGIYGEIINQEWYVKLILSFILSLLYPLMLTIMKKHYIKKFGKEIFENGFRHIGISYYIILLVLIVWGALG